MRIKAGISGAAGYTGGELIRLLRHHPVVDLAFAQSNSHSGKPLYEVHADLFGDTDLRFSEHVSPEVDVIFLCGGHGASKSFMQSQTLSASTKVIDLSQDFRLRADAQIAQRNFVYGLPELNKDFIRESDNVANPGCFATAIQLALLPLAKVGFLNDAYITGVTGSTGAGQAPSASTHFSWRANNVSAYKTLIHQHLAEVGESLRLISPDQHFNPAIHFVPWRGPFSRGIFCSTTLRCSLQFEDIQQIFREFYSAAPFTHITDLPLDLKQVLQTNKCLIQLEMQGEILVIHTAIDNLLKGASGQAVQNMNLMFGLDETLGLQLKAAGF